MKYLLKTLKKIEQSFNRYMNRQHDNKEETVNANDIFGDIEDYDVRPTQETSGPSLMTTVTNAAGHQTTMPRSWTPESMVNNILSHNKINSVTNIMLVGSTGSGKTTTAKRIIHGLHNKHPSYIILWFSRKDIMDMKKILKKIPKGRDVIMIFDDISFVTDLMSQKDKAEMGNEMATLRHTYLGESAKLITFSLIHYSKSAQKSSHFRSAHFTMATSLTGNEMANFEEIFGSKWILKNFAKIYRQSVLKGRYSYMTDGFNEKLQYYETADWHPVLVNEINHSHIMLVDKVDCKICGNDVYATEDQKKPVTEEEFIGMLKYPDSHVRKALKWYGFMKTGDLMLLPPMDRKIFRHLTKLLQHVNLDFERIVEIFDDRRINKPLEKRNLPKHKHV